MFAHESFLFYTPELEVEYTCGNLPHWHHLRVMQFVTFRLNDSLPKDVVRRILSERLAWEKSHPKPWTKTDMMAYRRIFGGRYEEAIDNGYGICYMNDRALHDVVANCILRFDAIRYEVHSFVVMPNHVHALLEITDKRYTIGMIVGSWKRNSAKLINEMLGATGQIWERESWDTMIRSHAHLHHALNYIEKNRRAAKAIRGW